MLFSIPARALRPGTNEITATVSYVDELGTPGESVARGAVTLTDANLFDRINFAFEDFGYWLTNLFS
jgi:hypothetical protein